VGAGLIDGLELAKHQLTAGGVDQPADEHPWRAGGGNFPVT
jgi:hypothetical protein